MMSRSNLILIFFDKTLNFTLAKISTYTVCTLQKLGPTCELDSMN